MNNIRIANGESEYREKTGFNENIPLFFSDSYRKYQTYRKSRNKQYILLFSSEYVIPVLIRKYFLFKYAELESTPFHYKQGLESEAFFLESVCRFLKNKLHVQWLLETPVYALFGAYPSKAKTIKFANTAIDLNKQEEDVFASLSYPFRKAVRRALKWDVFCRIGGKELIDDFAKLEAITWQRSGTSLDHTKDSFYDDLFECMSDNVVVSMSYKGDVPQAGLVCYYDEDTCYAMFGAHADEMEGGSNNLLYWQTMQWCINKGIKKFFIVGYRLKVDEDSKVARIQRFKDTFNGTHEEGFMFRMTFKPVYAKLYSKMLSFYSLIRTGKKTPSGGDIISQEIHKWPEYND